MDLVRNGAAHPHLRDEEAAVVENAIRLAIDSIINVLYGVNSGRAHEYQRMVADRDKEIQRLERRLREIEQEVKALRRRGCSCGLCGAEHGHRGGQTPAEHRSGERGRVGPSSGDGEDTAGHHECEMSFSLGLFARPPSHVSSQSHESAPPSSPSRLGLDQTSTSHSSDSPGVSDAARNLPPSPSSLVIKEEPCDIDTVLIKWEMSEDRFGESQESTSSPCQDKERLGVTEKVETREREKFREKPHADPDGQHVAEGEHLRNKKRSVPMSELPEEAQRLKRAAWRAASRRYYARKIARQQADPLHPGPFPHITDSRYAPPISFVDRRRKTLISELPEESQTQQREAWRAASRRYYARKMARGEAAQYKGLLHSMQPAQDTLAPNTGGGHGGGEGIMCS